MVFRNTNKIQQQGLQIQARSLPYLEKQNTISHRLQQGEQPGNEERGKVKFRINYIREKNKKDFKRKRNTTGCTRDEFE